MSDAALQEQQRPRRRPRRERSRTTLRAGALEAARRASDAVNEVRGTGAAPGDGADALEEGIRRRRSSSARPRERARRILGRHQGRGSRRSGTSSSSRSRTRSTSAASPTTLSRGVTVGKSIGALLIFVFGYQIAACWRRAREALMVERFAIARIAGEGPATLGDDADRVPAAVITLNLARIPLTVFAFMGGALAIGVGFGTQTLLRNLISGIIVLFERKVRVGDIVDVDGVQGIVTAVDVRSTTVRQFDGIETMVPNSLLLEKQGHQLDRRVADDAPGGQGRRGLWLADAAGGGHPEGGGRRARPGAEGSGAVRRSSRTSATTRWCSRCTSGSTWPSPTACRCRATCASCSRSAWRTPAYRHRVSAARCPPRFRPAAADRGRGRRAPPAQAS